MEVNVAINFKVETLFRGANVFHEGGRKIPRGGGNISSWGEEIFSPPGDFVMGETLFRDTGTHRRSHRLIIIPRGLHMTYISDHLFCFL